LYGAWPNTEPTEATFSTPDAATIMKMANTWGQAPHHLVVHAGDDVAVQFHPVRGGEADGGHQAAQGGLEPEVAVVCAVFMVVAGYRPWYRTPGSSFRSARSWVLATSRTRREISLVGVVEVAEHDGAVAGLGAGIGTGGGLVALVEPVHAQRAPLDAALAPRHVRLLVGDILVHERAGLVGAGHDAVAAADAGVAIHQHDAVGPLNEAPVGQTSTQGGSAQCWHITGTEAVRPVLISLISILRSHCGSVALLPLPRPFSVLQAVTQSVQPSAHLVVSINMPQRTPGLALAVGAAARAISISWMPGASIAPASPAAATPRKPRRLAPAGESFREMPGRSLIGCPQGHRRRRRPGCVAFEAIDLHGRVAVAADAEAGLALGTLRVSRLAWHATQAFRLNFAPRMPPRTVSSR